MPAGTIRFGGASVPQRAHTAEGAPEGDQESPGEAHAPAVDTTCAFPYKKIENK